MVRVRSRIEFREVCFIAAIFLCPLLPPGESGSFRELSPQPQGDRSRLEDQADFSDAGLLSLLPGGWRRLAAGYCWIQTYAAWENGDALAVIAGLEQTTQLDPGTLHFWINGARMLAHDLPRWQIATLGGEEGLPRAVCAQVEEEHTQAALRFLAKAETFHPMTAVLAIEAGTLHWHGRRDVTAAIDAFERATLCEDAPFHAFRIHAELLRVQGRTREAYGALCRFVSSLSPRVIPSQSGVQSGFVVPLSDLSRGRGDPQLDVVLTRIRRLERELEIEPSEAFKFSG